MFGLPEAFHCGGHKYHRILQEITCTNTEVVKSIKLNIFCFHLPMLQLSCELLNGQLFNFIEDYLFSPNENLAMQEHL